MAIKRLSVNNLIDRDFQKKYKIQTYHLLATACKKKKNLKESKMKSPGNSKHSQKLVKY